MSIRTSLLGVEVVIRVVRVAQVVVVAPQISIIRLGFLVFH